MFEMLVEKAGATMKDIHKQQDNIIIQYEIHKLIHIHAYTVTKTLQQLPLAP